MIARKEIQRLADEVKEKHPVYAGRRRPHNTTSSDYKRGYCHGYLDALDEVLEILEEEEG